VTRLKDAIQLKKKPDRIPVVPMTGFFPAYYSGMAPYDVMYDYEKMTKAWKKYIYDFAPDAHGGAATAVPGRMYEILDYKLYAWPGHGVPQEASYQCLESEYMKAEEYDDLIRDPSDFFRSVWLPRTMWALQPFRDLAPLTNMTEMYGGFTGFAMLPFGLPHVQEGCKKMLEAGSEALKWGMAVIGVDKEAAANGFPDFFGGGTKVPFDTLGDTLRGTKGIMMDMYRRPEKLMKALEVLTPIMIKMGASAAKMNGNPIVFIPLHKGADGFLSEYQFNKFYWPCFKDLLQGLIGEGCVPFPWAEGGYNSRLELIKGMPRGKVIWGFDLTDMKKAKKILGEESCITGNVPSSLLEIGTIDEVKAFVKKLIETCKANGGYIMMNGATLDNVKPENLKDMKHTPKERGVY
jgi:uroporphyrinogen-III decarboxylase